MPKRKSKPVPGAPSPATEERPLQGVRFHAGHFYARLSCGRTSGGIVSHVISDLEIRCLPADLPEFIEVDLKDLALGNIVHVKDLQLPTKTEIVLSKCSHQTTGTHHEWSLLSTNGT